MALINGNIRLDYIWEGLYPGWLVTGTYCVYTVLYIGRPYIWGWGGGMAYNNNDLLAL